MNIPTKRKILAETFQKEKGLDTFDPKNFDDWMTKKLFAFMDSSKIAFNKALMEEIPDYKMDSETKRTLERLEQKCMNILEAKDADYGGSWQKDGIFSVHFNLKRKFDRLHNIFKNGFKQESGESALDTLMDLRNYVSLYILYMLHKDPELLKEFDELK